VLLAFWFIDTHRAGRWQLYGFRADPLARGGIVPVAPRLAATVKFSPRCKLNGSIPRLPPPFNN
jgi:hypothetical protein